MFHLDVFVQKPNPVRVLLSIYRNPWCPCTPLQWCLVAWFVAKKLIIKDMYSKNIIIFTQYLERKNVVTDEREMVLLVL